MIADSAAIAAHVARARQVLGDAFQLVFDQALVRAHDRLRLDPGDREAKVAESISPPSEGARDVLGVEEGALAEFALAALNRRLALIGAPLDG